MTEEEKIIDGIRETFKRAKSFYEERGRTILAVDIECHLQFFEDALKFDRLDEANIPVDSAVN
jgi:hypothetical protein